MGKTAKAIRHRRAVFSEKRTVEIHNAIEEGFCAGEIALGKGYEGEVLQGAPNDGGLCAVNGLCRGELAVIIFHCELRLHLPAVNMTDLFEGFGEAAILRLNLLGDGDGFLG